MHRHSFRFINTPTTNLTHMKLNSINQYARGAITSLVVGVTGFSTWTASNFTARADETCSSPYLARIEGQEEFLYVWTLGAEGVGDGSDKLVVVDVKPGSANYGKVIHSH